MLNLTQLENIIQTGTATEGMNAKAIAKLQKQWNKLNNPRIVNLYPLRSFRYDKSPYCLYVCPMKTVEIDNELLNLLKEAAQKFEIGELRYDSVQTNGSDYFELDPETHNHLCDEEHLDSVMLLSNRLQGLLLFTKADIQLFSSAKSDNLDCHFALVGTQEKETQFVVKQIPNHILGLPSSGMVFEQHGDDASENTAESTSTESPFLKTTQYLGFLLLIIALIWWYFFR